MTAEQQNQIKKEVETFIHNLSHGNPIMKSEVREIIKDMFTDEDDFIVITWPEIQEFMDLGGFSMNSSLANDEWSLEKYGSSAYFVNKQWLLNTYGNNVE